MKLYSGSLAPAISDVLDQDTHRQLLLNNITSPISPSKTFYLFRHFESNYNTYKARIQHNPLYKEFLATTDPTTQVSLAQKLLTDFLNDVNIDYHTPLSPVGLQQANEYGKLYGELFSSSPDLFPDKIMISPYTRTKHTAHALLKNLVGLDLDIDFLLSDSDLSDMKIGTLQGKPIVLSLTDEIRERDFGNNFWPRFIRELTNDSWLKPTIDHIAQEKSYYYTSTNGGESQTMQLTRVEQFFQRCLANDKYKTRMLFTHHLTILSALKNIFGGSFNTFYNLDSHRKPKNGSLTILSELPADNHEYPSSRLRVAGYNLLPTDG
jgi:broad specificity phosphatase PhoE